MSFCTRRRCLIASLLAAVVAAVVIAVLVLRRPWNQTLTHHPHATVAANGYECASIGREILEKNGSAVDAAIATLFCEGMGCAQCMGLGGGFLATIYDKPTRTVRVLNARERAPAATTVDMFNNASSVIGGLAVAVPGELRGYGYMHQEYGRLPWAEVVLPVAALARRGHQVTEYMARVLASYSKEIKEEPSMRELYINPDTGEPWKQGDLIQEPTLARTLEIIAEEGPEAMHNGSLTSAFVRDIQSFGGIITEDDMRNYRPEWREPITAQVSDDLTMYTTPLPGSGGVLAFILNILRGYIGTGTPAPPDSGLYWHRLVETYKFAYAMRTGLGDPARNLTHNVSELERNLTHTSFADEIRAKIDDSRTYNNYEHYGGFFANEEDHGTAHVVVIAPDGSAVSVTSTINYIWGCHRRSTSLGVMLNNEMDDFAIPGRNNSYNLPPSPANYLAPGLQPLSSMVPAIVLHQNGTVKLVTGAAGGTKITTQIAFSTIKLLHEEHDLKYTMDQPRLHHQLMPMTVEYEQDFDKTAVEFLKSRGHSVTELEAGRGFAAMVAAIREPQGLVAYTDKRRKGSTDGF